ncbi:MAG: DNA-binding protein WhiA [Clostridiaceae bacterium]|jgi:DNA-binding protein WhiA|nr:DNA-binding protein WhiA [Eubacteriales bacterium]NLV48717.1 DNA-binding protein WhiA [Clostridiaceae bacterium]
MKGPQDTFSRRIKDELSQIDCEKACCRQVELAVAYAAAGKFQTRSIDLATSHAGCADRFVQLIRQWYHTTPLVRQGEGLITIRLKKEFDSLIRRDIVQVLIERQSADQWSLCCQQALLRSLFLISGSVSEPLAAYHMELAIRWDKQAAPLFLSLLERFGFRCSLVRRAHYDVLYLREGQNLSDYLLMSGAHQSLLTFESLRVEKEMRNNVNRIVNCDSANLQRMANTAARQSGWYRELEQKGLVTTLTEDLQAAARIRYENPDLSIKELGQLMQPPLGKSGMNHRLKRFEQKACELLTGKEPAS